MFVQSQVDALIQGVEGRTVIDSVRAYYKTHYSFEKNVSNIRRQYLSAEIRHIEYTANMQEIASQIHLFDEPFRAECIELFEEFKAMSLIDQHDVLHRTKQKGIHPQCATFNTLMRDLKLLPDNMKTFCLSKDDNLVCKIKKNNTLLKRNRHVIRVDNALELLNCNLHILENGSKNKISEILALLFVSGRRESEILNGKSAFEQVEGMPYYTKFTGVLKKKKNPIANEKETAILIPLLCTFQTFITALNRMRNSQKDDILSLTNKQVSSRYCSQLWTAQKTCFPMLSKTHDLRGLYVKCVDKLFIHDFAFPFLCMTCLGHDAIEDTLHYMSISISSDLDQFENSYGSMAGVDPSFSKTEI